MALPKTDPEINPSDSQVVPAPRPPFVVRGFGLTDTGKVRLSNEDHFAVVELARTLHVHQTSVPQPKAQYSSHRGHVFLVADGMGGHQAGEVASALSLLTVESFLLQTLKRFFRLAETEEHNVLKEFRNAVTEADARILEEAARHPDLHDMGTTLTMAFAVNWKLFVAHAGDSRCYLLSGGQFQQLTQDDTLVAELVRRGVITEQSAARHPFRHMVTNVLGGKAPGVRVHLHRVDLEPGDVMLLCTDGLTGMVPDERIAAVLQEQEPQAACERLVAEANERGGTDNITAVVARFEGA